MNEPLLSEIRKLSDEIFRPRAEEADQGKIGGVVHENIRLLASRGYFGLGISPEYGGFGADEATRREYTEIVASSCGVTAFVQQQLHAGGNFIGGAPSQSLKAEKLPLFAAGTELCGVAFSHLRRAGPPMVRVERVPGGFLVNGTAPWITGWSLLDSFILGAELPGQTHLFCYVPIHQNKSAFQASPPIPLVVMNASDTVEVTMTDLFVPNEHALSERPADSLQRSDFCGITGNVFLPLGCTRGSIHVLRDLANRRHQPRLENVADEFAREVDSGRQQAGRWSGACADLPEYKENALRVRASAIVLAVRAAHAAVAATGGSAHLLTNPAQRLLREAIFYTTIAQTTDVRSATLDLLISPECWGEN